MRPVTRAQYTHRPTARGKWTGLVAPADRCPCPEGVSCQLQAGHVADVLPLAVLEPVEVRRHRRSREILTRHSDEGPGKVREARCAGLIRKDARVELLRQPLPRAAVRA